MEEGEIPAENALFARIRAELAAHDIVLYIKGTFIGGCDITRELYATGVLQDRLRAAGILQN